MEKLSNIEKPNIEISFPTTEDINQILDIHNSVVIDNKKENSNIKEEGFLVNKINKNDLDYAINNNMKESFIIIAKNKDGKVVGYFLAYDMENFIAGHPDWFNETGVNHSIIKENKILYGKHLASDGTIKGVGSELNKQMFSIVKNRGYNLYLGEICEGPISNDKSLNFHINDFGMRKISEYIDKNGYKWGIFIKDL